MTGSSSRWTELGKRRLTELRRLARRPRVVEALKIALITLAALCVAYLAIANAVLRYGGVEWFVNSSTDDAHLTLGPSYTWFPGRVEVRGLKIRFEDRNVQFELVVPRASGKLSLAALARKRLDVRALEADGVRFRFRHKVASVAGNERRLVHFPRIEGFSDPPLLKPEPAADKSKNWAIRLDNVRARGAELWFMEYRYTGRADVTGAFELVPGRKLWVGPAHMDLSSGELAVGARRPLAHAVHGALDFRFRETNPDPIPGLSIFRQISAKFSLDGDLVDLEAANLYLSDASNIAVRRGAGHLRARVELVDGRFRPESHVILGSSEDVHVALPSAALSARVAAEFRARGRALEPTQLVAGASFDRVLVSLGDAKPSSPDVTARTLSAVLVTDNADVASAWKLEEASFRLVDGRIEDLRALDPSPRKERVVEAGSAWFFAHAELASNGKWSGVLRADARGARIRRGDRRLLLDGTLSASAESEHRHLENGSFCDVALQVTSAEARSSEPALRVNVRAPRVEWSGFPPNVARGRATLAAPRIEPLLEALGAPPIFVSLWPDAPVDASARFVVEENALDVRLDLAESGPFRAMGRLRVCSPAKGAFLVKSGAFTVGLSVRGGELRVVPLPGETWLAKNTPECPSEE